MRLQELHQREAHLKEELHNVQRRIAFLEDTAMLKKIKSTIPELEKLEDYFAEGYCDKYVSFDDTDEYLIEVVINGLIYTLKEFIQDS